MTYNTPNQVDTKVNTEEPLGKYGYTPHEPEVEEPAEGLKDSLKANAGNIALGVGLTALALNPNANIVNVDEPATGKVDPEQHREQMLTESEDNASQLASDKAYDRMAQEHTIVIPQPHASQNGLGPNNN